MKLFIQLGGINLHRYPRKAHELFFTKNVSDFQLVFFFDSLNECNRFAWL